MLKYHVAVKDINALEKYLNDEASQGHTLSQFQVVPHGSTSAILVVTQEQVNENIEKAKQKLYENAFALS